MTTGFLGSIFLVKRMYFEEYLNSLSAQSFSKYYLISIQNVFRQWQKFVEREGLSQNPVEWKVKDFTQYYEDLKKRPYEKTDNWDTGYLRNQSQRNRKLFFHSDVYIYQHFNYLKEYFSFLVANNRVYINPFDRFELPLKPRGKLLDVPTQKQIQLLMATADRHTFWGYRNYAILKLLYGCGLRRREVSLLNLSDLDFKDNLLVVRISKFSKGRIIPFGKAVKSVLEEYLTQVRKYLLSIDNWSEEALFINVKGNRLGMGSITRIVWEAARKVDLKGVTAHSLRHAFALHLIQNGADIRYAQELLGHAELQTTTVYTKLHDGDLKEKILRHHPGDAVLSKTIDLKSKFSPPLNAEIILSAQELTMKFPDETIISNASFGDVRKILKALRGKKEIINQTNGEANEY